MEWKELGEVCDVNKGKQLNKELLTNDGKYPAYNGGKTYSGRTNDYNVEANTIIVSQGGKPPLVLLILLHLNFRQTLIAIIYYLIWRKLTIDFYIIL